MQIHRAVYPRPAALAKLVEARVALPGGILALALRAAHSALSLSVQQGVVCVVVAPGFDCSPVALSEEAGRRRKKAGE